MKFFVRVHQSTVVFSKRLVYLEINTVMYHPMLVAALQYLIVVLSWSGVGNPSFKQKMGYGKMGFSKDGKDGNDGKDGFFERWERWVPKMGKMGFKIPKDGKDGFQAMKF